ncbi:helix-turn-helix transcriptional regulator [Pseudomonas paraversuta]|uniref:S24 family peptidase n=1 Tax=Pseudomonas paraversuta TaxID=2750624 RepID=UPI0019329DDD|nr:S24 family peptidase [Pseudomonas paraversuta]
MDIREVRRHNLKKLMDKEFGLGARGAQSRLAEKLKKPQNFISRCLFEPEKNGAKTIGEDFAREIEEAFGLTRYALDAPMGAQDEEVTAITVGIEKPRQGDICIPQYDVRASMGPGQFSPKEYVETVKNITVRSEYLREQGIIYTHAENLAVITGFGESMGSTFSSGDPLIVDKGITEVVVDGVYAFTLDGMLYIKRLQRLPKMIRMISDNEAFPTYDIKGAELESLVVHARVLLAWNARRL